MGRESHKREADGNGIHSSDTPTLCSNNCGFFGSAENHNLCSKCYRDLFLQKSKIDDVAEASTVQIDGGDRAETDSAAKEAAPTKRCGSGSCRKRVGLMGFKCRCGQTFCSLHRYSDKHGCPFDYKGAGQDAIAKANPVVKADKIKKI